MPFASILWNVIFFRILNRFQKCSASRFPLSFEMSILDQVKNVCLNGYVVLCLINVVADDSCTRFKLFSFKHKKQKNNSLVPHFLKVTILTVNCVAQIIYIFCTDGSVSLIIIYGFYLKINILLCYYFYRDIVAPKILLYQSNSPARCRGWAT